MGYTYYHVPKAIFYLLKGDYIGSANIQGLRASDLGAFPAFSSWGLA